MYKFLRDVHFAVFVISVIREIFHPRNFTGKMAWFLLIGGKDTRETNSVLH